MHSQQKTTGIWAPVAVCYITFSAILIIYTIPIAIQMYNNNFIMQMYWPNKDIFLDIFNAKKQSYICLTKNYCFCFSIFYLKYRAQGTNDRL